MSESKDNDNAYSVEVDGTTGLRRMTVSMGGKCPVGCRYCYTYDPDFKGYPVRSADEISAEIERRVDDFDLLQWGYDTEPFLPKNKETTFTVLERVQQMQKHVSYASRFPLEDPDADRLAKISERMRRDSKLLIAFNSYLGRRVIENHEPNAPTADQRLEGMRQIFSRGIVNFTFIRPLLPTITDEELAQVIAETNDRSDGHVVGEVFYRDSDNGSSTRTRRMRHEQLGLTMPTRDGANMSFGADENLWNVYEDPRIQKLTHQRDNVFAHSSEVVPFAMRKLCIQM